jgi:tetratricopeptide (TPR) repeat protein
VTGSKEDSDNLQKMVEISYRLSPDSGIVNAMMGYYHYEYQHEFEKAFQFHKKALEIGPNIGEVNFLAGVCYLYHGLYQHGIKYLARAIELDPYYFWAPYKLAKCYMSIGEFEKADFYFDKYFEIAPVVMMFPGWPIALNIRMKRYNKVEELVARTEKMRPDYWGMPYIKALLYAAKGEKDKALKLFKNSEVYSLLGMKDEAIEHLDKEIRKSVSHPHIFYYDLLNNPFYENLGNDPRFKEIIEREKKLYDEHVKKFEDI